MTHFARALVALVIAGLSVLSAGPVSAQSEDVRAAVESGNREWLAAFLRGDSRAIGNLYTTGAQAFPPQGEIVRGREAIARMWQGVLDSGVKGVTLVTGEIEATGETAYEVGAYSLTGDGGKVLDAGKYVVVWKREDGRWKLHRDIWNTSLPPAKP